MDESFNKKFLLQAANECVMFSQDALNGYTEHSDKVISAQFINLATQSIKPAQAYYLLNVDSRTLPEFNEFFHQFNQFSREFLWSLEGPHDFQHSRNFLLELENIFYKLKALLDT